MVVYTKRFCLHKIGSLDIIFIDSKTFKWNSVLPYDITLNMFILYLAPQSGFFSKCSAIADEVVVFNFSSFNGVPKHFSIFFVALFYSPISVTSSQHMSSHSYIQNNILVGSFCGKEGRPWMMEVKSFWRWTQLSVSPYHNTELLRRISFSCTTH